MKSPIRNVAVNVVLIVNLAGVANAAVTVNFDDLGKSSGTIGRSFDQIYAGVDWGDDDNERFISESVYSAYSEPASGDNYIYNNGGDNAMIDFSFIDSSAYLIGAYFAKASQNNSSYSADKVRFVGLDADDNPVEMSDWLNLTDTAQFLSADFDPVFRILVERDTGDTGKYSMDDLKYAIIPEPASLGLVVLGAFVFSAGKKRYFDRSRRR